jgi:hypothetical protein
MLYLLDDQKVLVEVMVYQMEQKTDLKVALEDLHTVRLLTFQKELLQQVDAL